MRKYPPATANKNLPGEHASAHGPEQCAASLHPTQYIQLEARCLSRCSLAKQRACWSARSMKDPSGAIGARLSSTNESPKSGRAAASAKEHTQRLDKAKCKIPRRAAKNDSPLLLSQSRGLQAEVQQIEAAFPVRPPTV